MYEFIIIIITIIATNAKHDFLFHMVVQRHCLGEVENVYTVVLQIYSGYYLTNVIRIW